MRTPPDKLHHHSLDAWESVFEPGLVATSRRHPEPWVAGHVHVVCGLPDQPDPVPTGGLPFHQLIAPLAPYHVTEGVHGGTFYIEEVERPGDVRVIPFSLAVADVRTTLRALTRDGVGAVNVLLAPEQMAVTCEAADLDYAAVEWLDRLPERRDPFLARLVHQLGVEAEAGGPSGRLYAEQLLQTAAMHLLLKHTAERPVEQRYRGGLPKARLRRVEEYVAEHLDREITLDALAEAAGGVAGAMNPYHFLRLFKRATGRTPYRWVIERRMEEARRRLRETDEAVIQVALAVGYQSPGHFSQVFRRHAGVTPTAYRRDLRR